MTNNSQNSHYSNFYTNNGIVGVNGVQGGRLMNGANQAGQATANGAGNIPQAGQMGQGRAYPDLGLQMDMNVLWDYIQNLSQLHEGIRTQTQQVLNGVEEVQRRRESRLEHVYEPNGLEEGRAPAVGPPDQQDTESVSQTSSAFARLQERVNSAENELSASQSLNDTVLSLLSDYETSLTHTLNKLRPFAQSHSTALIAQKAHYLALLEDERRQNLELRLEQQAWQERLRGVVGGLRDVVTLQGEGERPWRERCEDLRAENATLRRLLGVEGSEDMDEFKSGDGNEETAEEGLGGRRSMLSMAVPG